MRFCSRARDRQSLAWSEFRRTEIASKSTDAGPLAITNDGRYVYRVAHGGRLLMWDMKTSKFKETALTRVQEMHSNVDFVTLANDDKWVVIAGNHGDAGLFDRLTSRLVSYTRVSSAPASPQKSCSGFAAGCEARLCLAVASECTSGCAPGSGLPLFFGPKAIRRAEPSVLLQRPARQSLASHPAAKPRRKTFEASMKRPSMSRTFLSRARQ